MQLTPFWSIMYSLWLGCSLQTRASWPSQDRAPASCILWGVFVCRFCKDFFFLFAEKWLFNSWEIHDYYIDEQTMTVVELWTLWIKHNQQLKSTALNTDCCARRQSLKGQMTTNLPPPPCPGWGTALASLRAMVAKQPLIGQTRVCSLDLGKNIVSSLPPWLSSGRDRSPFLKDFCSHTNVVSGSQRQRMLVSNLCAVPLTRPWIT